MISPRFSRKSSVCSACALPVLDRYPRMLREQTSRCNRNLAMRAVLIQACSRFLSRMSLGRGTFEVHRSIGSHLMGVHFELTGEDVTECIGGPQELSAESLPRNYVTSAGPGRKRRTGSRWPSALLREGHCVQQDGSCGKFRLPETSNQGRFALC